MDACRVHDALNKSVCAFVETIPVLWLKSHGHLRMAVPTVTLPVSLT